MKQLIVTMMLCLPFLVKAQQTANGIRFVQGLTWEQVKEKAKKENKYIFLDCYATWCGPCKAMDRDTYPNETVGHLINEKFIAVKVQMDSTRYDDESIKRWYRDAQNIQSGYAVTAFPTYLFFSPDGKAVHKAAGYKNPDLFVSLAKDALLQEKQYYHVLANFEPGKLDTSKMKELARSFRGSGGKLAEEIAADYLNRIPSQELVIPDNLQFVIEFRENPRVQEIVRNYLSSISGKDLCAEKNMALILYFNQVPQVQDIVFNYLNNQALFTKDHLALLSIFVANSKAKAIADRYISGLPEKEIYTKGNIEFLANFTKSPKDKGFAIFYRHSKQVDSAMSVKDYAQATVDNIITTETVGPYWESAFRGEEVPWEKISKEITKKYNRQYADRIVLRTKVIVYKNNAEQHNKNWPEYIKYNIEQIEKYGTDTTSTFWDAMLLNNFAFEAIFKHSIDIKQINKAIKWMEGVIRRNPTDGNSVDTYANLLFKAGRRQEAIRWQEKALRLSPEDPAIKDNLTKMKSNIPTWIQKAD